MRIPSDQEWFSTLFRAHYHSLCRMASLLLHQQSTAEELVEETFLTLWYKREHLREHPNIEGWLFVTLRHRICSEVRLAKYQKETPLLFETGIPEENMAFEDSLSDLLPAGLTPSERQSLILYFEQQLSYEDMAEILGISVVACRTRLCRAKAHCKRLIEARRLGDDRLS